MVRDVLLIGGGSHASVVAEALRAGNSGLRLAAIVDGTTDRLAALHSVRHFATDEEASAAFKGGWAVLGVGQIGISATRARIVAYYELSDVRWATVVHPSAYVSEHAEIGAGAVVLTGAIVHPGAKVGCHAVINTGSVIEHDVRIGEHVMVSPAAAIGGGTVVQDGAFIGLGALCRDHITVGAGALIGMGAVVITDVPPGARFVGNPAGPLSSSFASGT